MTETTRTIIHYMPEREGLPEDPIDRLFHMLATEPLDPVIDALGGFDPDPDETGDGVRIWGNLANVSFAFSIDTSDPALIARWNAAVAANKATPSFAKAKHENDVRVAFWAAKSIEAQEEIRRDSERRHAYRATTERAGE